MSFAHSPMPYHVKYKPIEMKLCHIVGDAIAKLCAKFEQMYQSSYFLKNRQSVTMPIAHSPMPYYVKYKAIEMKLCHIVGDTIAKLCAKYEQMYQSSNFFKN